MVPRILPDYSEQTDKIIDDDLLCESCQHEKIDHVMYVKSVGERTEIIAKCRDDECDCSGTPKELFGIDDSEITEEERITNEFAISGNMVDTVTDGGNAISGKKTKMVTNATEIHKLFGTKSEQEIRDIFKGTWNLSHAKFLNLE